MYSSSSLSNISALAPLSSSSSSSSSSSVPDYLQPYNGDNPAYEEPLNVWDINQFPPVLLIKSLRFGGTDGINGAKVLSKRLGEKFIEQENLKKNQYNKIESFKENINKLFHIFERTHLYQIRILNEDSKDRPLNVYNLIPSDETYSSVVIGLFHKAWEYCGIIPRDLQSVLISLPEGIKQSSCIEKLHQRKLIKDYFCEAINKEQETVIKIIVKNLSKEIIESFFKKTSFVSTMAEESSELKFVDESAKFMKVFESILKKQKRLNADLLFRTFFYKNQDVFSLLFESFSNSLKLEFYELINQIEKAFIFYPENEQIKNIFKEKYLPWLSYQIENHLLNDSQSSSSSNQIDWCSRIDISKKIKNIFKIESEDEIIKNKIIVEFLSPFFIDCINKNYFKSVRLIIENCDLKTRDELIKKISREDVIDKVKLDVELFDLFPHFFPEKDQQDFEESCLD